MVGVYLIHFSRPLGRARHYLGWSSDIDKRYADHVSGRGARIMAAVVRAGISTELVRRWEEPRSFESELKARRDTSKLCPLCREAALRRKAEGAARRRDARRAA